MPTPHTEPTHLLAAGTPQKEIVEHVGGRRPASMR